MSDANNGSYGSPADGPGAPESGTGPYPGAQWRQPPDHPMPPGGWRPPGAPAPAPRPGVIPLRPLAVGEIVDGAIKAVRRYPALMLGASVIVVALSQVLTLVATRSLLQGMGDMVSSGDPTALLNRMGSISGNYAITIAVTSLAQMLLTGFLTVVVGQAVLGRPISFGEAWSRLRPRLLPLLGLTILYGLLVLAGAILLIVPGVWLGVLYGLATPALVLESRPIGAAFRRSRELVRGLWWRTFGVFLLGSLIATITSGIIALPFSLTGSLLTFSSGSIIPSTTVLLLDAIGGTVGGTITYPFAAAVGVLLYFDQRMRREGLDIELARQAGVPMPDPGHPASPYPPAPW